MHHGEDTQTLKRRLAEAEEMLHAIRHGEVDAVVVEDRDGSQVYTLHSAEEPYRNLIEQMQEGAVVLSGNGHILYCNMRFAAIVGEPPETVVGSHAGRFINDSDRGDFDRFLAAGSGTCRSSLIGSGSGAVEAKLSLTTTRSTGGARLNLIVTDLTELLSAKNNHDRAERASRSKDEFLATLAHELRTPISAITSAIDVMASPDASGETAARSHRIIRRQVSHIAHLVDDLLDIERVVAGKVRLRRQPMDLSGNVEHIAATFRSGGGRDRQIDVIAEPVWAECDPVRFDQVLMNLIGNAVKYTPPGGRILVTLRPDAGDAVLTIEDTGVGISARLLPFIFDMFTQADRTLDRAEGGLGIGLTVVRRLVELHGGTVTASSEGEGHGSMFTVRLKQIPAAEQLTGEPVARDRRERPRRVLLIEDNADAREMLRMVLELAGHIVYDAPDGVKGLELVNVVRPDVGIIDIGLPMMDGYEVASRIRKERHGRGMLLLALSGYGSSGDARRSLEHGFDYHIVKPVDHDRLTRLITQGLSAA